MCLLRINLPNLCPNMNHFSCSGFQWMSLWRCHSEEVHDKFLLTLRLYTRSLGARGAGVLQHPLEFFMNPQNECNLCWKSSKFDVKTFFVQAAPPLGSSDDLLFSFIFFFFFFCLSTKVSIADPSIFEVGWSVKFCIIIPPIFQGRIKNN